MGTSTSRHTRRSHGRSGHRRSTRGRSGHRRSGHRRSTRGRSGHRRSTRKRTTNKRRLKGRKQRGGGTGYGFSDTNTDHFLGGVHPITGYNTC